MREPNRLYGQTEEEEFAIHHLTKLPTENAPHWEGNFGRLSQQDYCQFKAT